MVDEYLRLRDEVGRLVMKVQRIKNRLYKIALQTTQLVCLLANLDNEAWVWHARLGHVNFHVIEWMVQKDLVRGVPSIKHPEQVCEGCMVAKQTRRSFSKESLWRASILRVLRVLEVFLRKKMKISLQKEGNNGSSLEIGSVSSILVGQHSKSQSETRSEVRVSSKHSVSTKRSVRGNQRLGQRRSQTMLTMASPFTKLQLDNSASDSEEEMNKTMIKMASQFSKLNDSYHQQVVLTKKLAKETKSFENQRKLFEGQIAKLSLKLVELNNTLSVSQGEKADLLIKVTDLEDSLAKERRLITSLKKDLQNEHDQMLKHSFGNAQNLKLVTSLRKENECLKKKFLELDDDKMVFENKFISSQSKVTALSKQLTEFEQIVVIARSNFEKERKFFEEERKVFENERKSFELNSVKLTKKISDLENQIVFERKDFEKTKSVFESKKNSLKKPSLCVGKYQNMMHDFEEEIQVVKSERKFDEKKSVELQKQIVDLQNQLSDVRNKFKQKEKVLRHEKTVLEQIIAKPKKPSLVEKDFEDQKKAFKNEIKKLTSKLAGLSTDIMNEQRMR
ncbi:hypothetical protein OSB04_024538 [Centaurea solstitialis]|uniref:GAG-pre-integrase domain-containing protein n=1 Tax=Centaurea solstitialis TaxID=347529 RepID=A0AA38SZP0_9ASTR|nr:hypothetical protein OSB04_024538 [Centaurea solstitialis]